MLLVIGITFFLKSAGVMISIVVCKLNKTFFLFALALPVKIYDPFSL